MTLHPETFDYRAPTPEQVTRMEGLRRAAANYAFALQDNLPDNADRTYLLRKLREVAIWANICVTRHSDGAPRE